MMEFHRKLKPRGLGGHLTTSGKEKDKVQLNTLTPAAKLKGLETRLSSAGGKMNTISSGVYSPSNIINQYDETIFS